jgi:hypothetical protein
MEDTIFWGVGEDGDTTAVRNEAIQVAATAMRIIMQISLVPVDLPNTW